MGTDFRPIGIRTLVANEENSMTGLRALRAGGGMTYAFGRNAATVSALGAVDTLTAVAVIAGGVALGADYETAVSGGGVSAETLRTLNPTPAVGDGANVAFTYDAFTALDYEETLKVVKVGGVTKTLNVDYTDAANTITFTVAPGNGLAVVIAGQALGTPVYTIARVPAIPAGSSAVEVLVMKDDTPETLTLTTDYLITNGGLTVTLTAAGIDKAVSGKTVTFFYKATNDKFTATLTVPPAADANNSAASLIVVKVDGTEKVLTTDYTTDGAGVVTMEATDIPTVGQVVTLFWRKLNDRFAHGGVDSGADETVSVWVDGVKKTVTADYVVNGANVDFVFASIPTVGQSVDFNVITANAVMIAGATLFFDTHGQNRPAWNHIIPTSAAVVEVM